MKLHLLIAVLIWVPGMSYALPKIIKEERRLFESSVKNNPDIDHHLLSIDQHQLHYASNGDSSKPTLIIIHGTPSDWRQYARYLLDKNLLKNFFVVVVDRPGWGQSTLANGQTIGNFQTQAKIIAALAKKMRQQSNGQAVVLMGHSLGASMAPRVAMDYPELIDGLLLLAGTVDPSLSSPRWFNYLARIPLANYLMSEDLKRSNLEIFALKKNVSNMAQHWDKLEAEVIAIQGMRDKLVYPKNSDYLEKTLDPKTTTVIRLSNEGHLFPMTLREQVAMCAAGLLDRINSRAHAKKTASNDE